MLLEAEAVEERIVSDRDYQYDDIRCCEPRVLSFYLPRPFARIIVRNRLDEARTGPLFTNPFVRINWSYDWAFVYPCSSKIFSAIKLPLNMGNSVSAEERQEFQMVEKVRYPNLYPEPYIDFILNLKNPYLLNPRACSSNSSSDALSLAIVCCAPVRSTIAKKGKAAAFPQDDVSHAAHHGTL